MRHLCPSSSLRHELSPGRSGPQCLQRVAALCPARPGSMWAQVRMTMGKVEERLWSIVRSFAALGRDHPAMLVTAVRIIELQELVDRSLEASTGGEPIFRVSRLRMTSRVQS